VDFNKIFEEIKKRRFTFRSVAQSVGISEPGLRGTIKNGTLKIEDLELISKKIEVPMTYWWEDEPLQVKDREIEFDIGKSVGMKPLIKENKELKNRVKLLEMTLENLNDQINDMKQKTGYRKAHT